MTNLFELNLKDLSEKELKKLIKDCKSMKKKYKKLEDEVVNELSSRLDDFESKFDLWVKKGKKIHYDYITYLDDIIRDYLRTNDFNRYQTIDLDYILSMLQDQLEDEDISKEEYEKLCKALMESNFKSVIWDW